MTKTLKNLTLTLVNTQYITLSIHTYILVYFSTYIDTLISIFW